MPGRGMLYSLRGQSGKGRMRQFDFLVLGGGSGGLAAAQRAAEYGASVALFEPARDKIYRHPTFYSIPEEVKNL